MTKEMKAALYHEFGDVDKINIDTLELPEIQEGEVLVRIEAAGVNPVDNSVLKGYLKSSIPPEFPVIPGWDMAGVIEERGFGARRFSTGDKVYGYIRRPILKWGTFAEYAVLPESYLALSPPSIPPEEAGAIPLTGLTAYQSLYVAGNLEKEQTILILGASGGVGSFAIQLAAARGAQVIGVASQKNHAYMEDLGADETIDYQDGDIEEIVMDNHEEGVDLIFDCAGGDTLQQSVPVLMGDGKIVSILSQGENIDSNIDFEYVFVEPNSSHLVQLRKLVESGQIDVPVSKTYALEETREALKQIGTLHTTGKIVITP